MSPSPKKHFIIELNFEKYKSILKFIFCLVVPPESFTRLIVIIFSKI